MTLSTDIYKLRSAWKMMEQWRKETRTKVGKHQWVEEWFLKDWKLPGEVIHVCYPISE